MPTANETTIKCPKCGANVPLTEAVAAPLVEHLRQEHAAELSRLTDDVSRRETALMAAEVALSDTVALRVKTERDKLEGTVQRRVRELVDATVAMAQGEVETMRETLRVNDEKLREAQEAQALAVRRGRELDERERELGLTLERRLSEETSRIRTEATAAAEAELSTKVTERDHTIEQMRNQIDDLKRRAEQGSQQLQGEAQELELEAALRAAFPVDTIEPIGKGQHGADCVQRVATPRGVAAGAILWESKRTKNWGSDWPAKLRDDMRASTVEIAVAVIVSRALPDEVRTFGLVDNVWICAPQYAVPLAAALRQAITGIAAVRDAETGLKDKAQLLYTYLTGTRFRHRIEAIVERVTDLREDLDKERKFMAKQFAKREEGMVQVVGQLSGLYGDLQGIAGATVAELPALEPASLTEAK